MYGQPAPMSSIHFKDLARRLISESDAEILELCTLDPEPPVAGVTGATYAEPSPRTPSDFLNHWRDWERVLRLNLARGRAQKLKREGGAAVDAPEYPADAAAVAKNAQTMESPLDAEIFLDKARWDAIEYFQGISSFGENVIFAYLLKLLLLERRAAFKTEEGYTRYKGLYTAILERASGADGIGFAPGLGSETTVPGDNK